MWLERYPSSMDQVLRPVIARNASSVGVECSMQSKVVACWAWGVTVDSVGLGAGVGFLLRSSIFASSSLWGVGLDNYFFDTTK